MLPRNRKSFSTPADSGVRGTFRQGGVDGFFFKSLVLESPSFIDNKDIDMLDHPAQIAEKLHENFPGRFTGYNKTSLRAGIRRICNDPDVKSHLHREFGVKNECELFLIFIKKIIYLFLLTPIFFRC